MKLIFLLVIFCSAVILPNDGYRILGLFPHPGLSHFQFFHPIMRGLAEAGHDVTVISHFPDKNPPAHYKDLVLTGVELLTNSVNLKVMGSRTFYSQFLDFFLVNEWGKTACNHTLKSPALAQVLKQKTRYDVIMMEQFNTDCLMSIAHILQAPVIALSSCAILPWYYERFEIPMIPSYIPNALYGPSHQMTFPQRFINWFSHHGLTFLYKKYSHKPATDMVRRKFGQDFPDIEELAKETALVFVNQHYSLSGAIPYPPNVIELGGVHIPKAKPLDVDIQRYLDNAEHGVIVISWGSMIKAETLPEDKRNSIVKALRRIKQKVIWKWENDTLTNQPANVLVRKWLPQRDILCHPNVKAFMTHAGLLGITEAIYCGVPTIATPIYGDQFLNAAALVDRGIGIILNYEDITENNTLKALRKIVEKKYLETAKNISYTFRNRPRSAMETAIWWVEHTIKTKGTPYTKPYGVQLSRFVYYSLDVYCLLLFIITLSTLSWLWLCRQLRSSKRPIEKIKNN